MSRASPLAISHASPMRAGEFLIVSLFLIAPIVTPVVLLSLANRAREKTEAIGGPPLSGLAKVAIVMIGIVLGLALAFGSCVAWAITQPMNFH